MSVGAIGAGILGGGMEYPPPWYTSLKHPMALGVKIKTNKVGPNICQISSKKKYDYLAYMKICQYSSQICGIWQEKPDWPIAELGLFQYTFLHEKDIVYNIPGK